MKKLDYELIKIDMQILDDIEENNIKGYIELLDFYENKREFEKINIIKKNHTHFYTYIISKNRSLKQKFNYLDYINKKYENK